MSEVPPRQRLAAAGTWPVVGENQPRQSSAAWEVSIGGEVENPRTYTLEEITSFPQRTRLIDVHCVTRWSKIAMSFSGVLLSDLLRTAVPNPAARFVSFVARSDRNHSTSLPLSELFNLNSMLALKADGQPLATEHGGPVRMVVPGKYFYKSVKWVERIDVLREDRLGFWESDAGYHNGADPWKEERYIVSSLSKQAVRQLMESRDFRNQELLSLHASGRDLAGLNAEAALIRNGNFDRCNLVWSNFKDANLSNASFRHADLRHACFTNADLEGADFSDAKLDDADFEGASLFGTTFD